MNSVPLPKTTQSCSCLSDASLRRKAPGGKETVGRLVRGVAAHDLYHAGQIQLLKRLLHS